MLRSLGGVPLGEANPGESDLQWQNTDEVQLYIQRSSGAYRTKAVQKGNKNKVGGRNEHFNNN